MSGTRTRQTSAKSRRSLAAKPIKLSPRRALAKIRKPVAPPSRVEEVGSYRRSMERRRTREIIVDEIQGC